MGRRGSRARFPDEINAEVFGNWDPYREHIAKRTSFNPQRYVSSTATPMAEPTACFARSSASGSGKAVVTLALIDHPALTGAFAHDGFIA